MRLLISLLILAPFAAAGAYHAALNLCGEVVLLYHYDAEGREYLAPVWLMRERGDLFVRATDPQRLWLERIRNHPEVSLRRDDGQRQRYLARVEPHRRERVNQLARERYGWGEWLLSRLEDRSRSVPIRLASP